MISSIDLIDSFKTTFTTNPVVLTSLDSKPTAEKVKTSPVYAPMVKVPSALETTDKFLLVTEIVAPEIGSFDALITEPLIPD
jgi:hypothetical protein